MYMTQLNGQSGTSHQLVLKNEFFGFFCHCGFEIYGYVQIIFSMRTSPANIINLTKSI